MQQNVLDDAIHVWFMNPDKPVEASKLDQLHSVLSAAERERYRRFHFPHDARRYLMAHALTRIALSGYADIKPAEWRFSFGEYGRPEISSPDGSALRFNLSHTAGLVGCVISHHSDCGFDIENNLAQRNMPAVARRVFSKQEYEELLQLRGHAAREYFFSRWTLREAYVKALGIGISFPTRQLLFSVSPGGTVSADFLPGIDDCNDNWQFSLINPTREHVAAVAVRRNTAADRKIVVRFVNAGELAPSATITGN